MAVRFYVSSKNEQTGQWGITDTSDGVEVFVTEEALLRTINMYKLDVKGVTSEGIHVADAGNVVLKPIGESMKKDLWNEVNTYTQEDILACYNRYEASTACGVKLKSVRGQPSKKGSLLAEDYTITKSLEEQKHGLFACMVKKGGLDALDSIQKYGNSIEEVDITDVEAIKVALQNNICAVVQRKRDSGRRTGAPTAFLCTSSLSVMDNIYGAKFFDTMLFTKALQSVVEAAIAPTAREGGNNNEKPGLNVFSCSLRFKDRVYKKGKKAGLSFKITSTLNYTVVPENVTALYIVKNPDTSVQAMLNEMRLISEGKVDASAYDFDLNLFAAAYRLVASGTTMLTKDILDSLASPSKVRDELAYTTAIDKFAGKVRWMASMRAKNCSY